MRNGLAWIVLTLGLFGATGALAQDPLKQPGPVKHRHGARATEARSSVPQATGSSGPVWDRLVKGSADQQAAERRDNDLAGVKPIDHRKDDFFSDWRGLR